MNPRLGASRPSRVSSNIPTCTSKEKTRGKNQGDSTLRSLSRLAATFFRQGRENFKVAFLNHQVRQCCKLEGACHFIPILRDFYFGQRWNGNSKQPAIQKKSQKSVIFPVTFLFNRTTVGVKSVTHKQQSASPLANSVKKNPKKWSHPHVKIPSS